MRWLRIALAVLVLALAAPPARAGGVVSLNLCTDQLLVLLAPERIAALSHLARDPSLSFVASRAGAWPAVRASAEAVLRLQPDMVLAAPWGARAALTLLRAQGVRVETLSLPRDLDGIRAQVRGAAALLGHPERGEALLAGMEATLAGVAVAERMRRGIAWQPRGYTADEGSLVSLLMARAGIVNVGDGRRLGAEAMLRDPPDVLVVPAAPATPSRATEMLTQPALAAIARIPLPTALTVCAGPYSADAARLMVAR